MGENNNSDGIWGEEESEARNEHIYERKVEVNTLGTSDMSDSNSIMEDEGERRDELGKMSEEESDQVMGQDRVNISWEDYSIVENMREKENEESCDENNETETSYSRSDNSGDTIIPNESTFFDREIKK